MPGPWGAPSLERRQSSLVDKAELEGRRAQVKPGVAEVLGLGAEEGEGGFLELEL